MVNSHGLTGGVIEGIGRMGNNMGKGFMLLQMEGKKRVSGKKERECDG